MWFFLTNYSEPMSADKSIFITEEDKLRIRLKRSHTQRFRMLMELIKMSRKVEQAKNIHTKP